MAITRVIRTTDDASRWNHRDYIVYLSVAWRGSLVCVQRPRFRDVYTADVWTRLPGGGRGVEELYVQDEEG